MVISCKAPRTIDRVPSVGILVVVIDVNPSHGFWTRRLMKLFEHEEVSEDVHEEFTTEEDMVDDNNQ